MDVFALRDRVVAEYRDYFESFIHILDDRLEKFVKDRLADGEMWPDAVLQLNPAYEPGPTLGELGGRGVVTPEMARFFGEGLRLYRHQEEALQIAQRGEPYIVSTGTGSGKSLTYLIPIFDHIIRYLTTAGHYVVPGEEGDGLVSPGLLPGMRPGVLPCLPGQRRGDHPAYSPVASAHLYR